VAPLAQQSVKGYDLSPSALWAHSLATALTAEALARETGVADPGDAYTAGMLHDLGKIVMGNFVDVDIERIFAACSDAVPFDAAEREVLGTDHASIAGALLRNWQFPASIIDAVLWHHRPNSSEVDQSLTDIVHLADVLSLDAGWGMGADGLRYEVEPAAADRVQLARGAGELVMATIQPELEELMSLFHQMTEGKADVVEHSAR
jgi:putative nucleotidyltransferase with HDIG domain